jgi:anti-sigma regulatory factor (Ser/Thr protein kinase)
VADEITLTIPRDPEFHRVAHLVLGGLAVRLDLTIENLEDLEIALDSILARTDPPAGEITIRMSLGDGELEAVIGPLTPKLLEEIARQPDGGLGLRRVLDSTVEDVRIDGDYVRLTKKVAIGG